MTYTLTFRQLKWFATLYRHSSEPVAASPWPRAHRRAMLAACLLLMGHTAADGATLRNFGELSGRMVHLSDLFENLGTAPDRVLGPAPAPGDRIVVEAPQLAAIARDYSVDWRPESGAERVILERAGERLTQAAVMEPLRTALTEAGAAADGDIALPGFDPPLLPTGDTPHSAVTEATYDPASSRFTAVLNVSAAGMETVRMRLAGQVTAMADAAVLTHHVRIGSVLETADLRTARVRMTLLRGNLPLTLDAALGQALRHDLPPGQPLTSADVSRPVLVARGSFVHMLLDAGGISLSAEGTALEEGGLGDTVRVQNPTSKAVVLASVTSPGEVRVMPERAVLEVAAQ